MHKTKITSNWKVTESYQKENYLFKEKYRKIPVELAAFRIWILFIFEKVNPRVAPRTTHFQKGKNPLKLTLRIRFSYIFMEDNL